MARTIRQSIAVSGPRIRLSLLASASSAPACTTIDSPCCAVIRQHNRFPIRFELSGLPFATNITSLPSDVLHQKVDLLSGIALSLLLKKIHQISHRHAGEVLQLVSAQAKPMRQAIAVERKSIASHQYLNIYLRHDRLREKHAVPDSGSGLEVAGIVAVPLRCSWCAVAEREGTEDQWVDVGLVSAWYECGIDVESGQIAVREAEVVSGIALGKRDEKTFVDLVEGRSAKRFGVKKDSVVKLCGTPDCHLPALGNAAVDEDVAAWEVEEDLLEELWDSERRGRRHVDLEESADDGFQA